MAKVFQIINNMCSWQTPYHSIKETVGRYPADIKFVEAPDYVYEGWGYMEEDKEGNPIEGEERFIQPEAPEGWIYDVDTGTFYPESDIANRLEKAKEQKQNENKAAFASFLANHPITWKDGKKYGVTMEDQNEISLNLSQYQVQLAAGVKNPTLEWHAIKEACVAWSYDDLSALVLTISEYVYPWFHKMNEYKEKIFAIEDAKDINTIELDYRTEEEIAADEAKKAEEAAMINDITEETTESETDSKE